MNYIWIIGMIVVGALVYFLAIPAEDQLLDSLVTTGPNIMLDAWREVFRNWATLGTLIALGAAVFWFVLGQLGQGGFSMNRWTNVNNKRWVWGVFFVVAVLAAAPGYYFTPTVQEGGRLTLLFYLANNVLVYYFATLLFSPSSFKYMPLGAASVRRYW